MRLCALFHAVLSITFIGNGQVNYSASRGYHLKIPANIASIPDDFIQCVQGLAGPSGPPRPEATVFFGLPSSIPYTQTPCLGASPSHVRPRTSRRCPIVPRKLFTRHWTSRTRLRRFACSVNIPSRIDSNPNIQIRNSWSGFKATLLHCSLKPNLSRCSTCW